MQELPQAQGSHCCWKTETLSTFADFGCKIKCNRLKPTCEACQAFNCACIYGGSYVVFHGELLFAKEVADIGDQVAHERRGGAIMNLAHHRFPLAKLPAGSGSDFEPPKASASAAVAPSRSASRCSASRWRRSASSSTSTPPTRWSVPVSRRRRAGASRSA